MIESMELVSKVLVLDSDPASYDRIKSFCDSNNLVGLRVQSENVMSVLRSNVDLGGILLSEHYDGLTSRGLQLANRIHAIRPELPIFLRRDNSANLEDIAAADRKALTAAYTIDNMDLLQSVIDEYIFSVSYPNVLVRGIAEISKIALQSQFKDMVVEVAPPFIVRDRLIHGEVFTLIPLESAWCRGYMMLQTEEFPLLRLVKANKTHISPLEAFDFRNLNSVLGEITNLIWGAFRNRFMSDETRTSHLSQVPIVINHLHRFISFGSENPQLCFKYTLTDSLSPDGNEMVLYQKFVFNLSWSPEDFRENQISIEDLVESGELDLF